MPTPCADTPDSPLPDFCTGRAMLSLAVAMQLFAICFSLAAGTGDGPALPKLLMLSIYLQWIGLCCAAALCGLRRRLQQAPPAYLIFICWGVMVLVVLVVANLAWWVDRTAGLQLTRETQWAFVLRQGLLAGIVALLLLRYFFTRHQWMQQVRQQSEARYQALTARIRPHFLFNALNSLAALIRVRPRQAEALVEDLAEVFRASLEDRGQMSTLAEELDICRAYLRIEKARLDDKLEIRWDVPDALLPWPLPMLTVQPLVENAVYHGISRLNERGDLRIRASVEDSRLRVEISNPLPPPDDSGRRGHRLALDNIAGRLQLLYRGRARLETAQHNGRYVARLWLPPAPIDPRSTRT